MPAGGVEPICATKLIPVRMKVPGNCDSKVFSPSRAVMKYFLSVGTKYSTTVVGVTVSKVSAVRLNLPPSASGGRSTPCTVAPALVNTAPSAPCPALITTSY